MRTRTIPRFLCGNLLFFVLVLPLAAQGPIEKNATASTIEDARKQIEAKKWLDAIEQFQRILDSSGDELVPVDRHQFLPARWVCFRHLSRMADEGLNLYRQRIDPQAQKRLDEARKSRDSRLLERILSESFCSRATEEAIHLLAERSLERGDLDAAERYWRFLLPERDPSDLRYPKPRTEPAAVEARLILVRLFRGELEVAEKELTAFQKKYPQASGRLAGKDGVFAETLQALLKQPELRTIGHAAVQNSAWFTFAADENRNGTFKGSLPYYFPDRPNWEVTIPSEASPVRRKEESVPATPDHPRALAFHPVILNDYVLLCDACRIFAYGLTDGKPAPIFLFDDKGSSVLDLRKFAKFPNADLQLPARWDFRYTLSVSEGNLFVRLGSQSFRAAADGNEQEAKETDSFVLCLGPTNAKKQWHLGKRWLLKAPQSNPDTLSIFEGSPLVQGDQLYIGLWRLVGGEAISSVLCYEGIDTKETPRLAWQQDIGKSSVSPTGEPRHKAEVLTLTGSNVVFGSPSGTIIALDGRSGKPAWEYRYPKRNPERRNESVYGRDLCPCVYEGGRIFAAPADADRVFCLDAFSGAFLWESRGMEVMHLLGVSRGKLICTLDRPMRGICGLNTETGTERNPHGWLHHDGDGQSTFGRGFIADGIVLWPTKHGLHFLREDGAPLRQPIPGMHGNLCFSNDTMIVTTATEIRGHVLDKTKSEEPPKQVERTQFPIRLKPNPQVDFPLSFDVPMKRIWNYDFTEQSPKRERGMDPPASLTLRTLTKMHVGFPAELVSNDESSCLIAGPDGVAVIQPDKDRFLSRESLVGTKAASRITGYFDERYTPGLNSFRRVGNRLYCLHDQNRLLAIDLDQGKVVWQHWAVSETGLLGSSATVFRPFYYADEKHFLAQLSTGEVRLIDVLSGAILKKAQGTEGAWKADPVVVAKGQVVFPINHENIQRLDLETAMGIWAYSIPHPSNLVGTLPKLRNQDQTLLMEIARNHTYELDAIDSSLATRIWKEPIRLEGECEFTSDSTNVYVVNPNGLTAYSLKTGERVWESPIPLDERVKWSIRMGSNAILIIPRNTIGDDIFKPIVREGERMVLGGIRLDRLFRSVRKSYDAWRNRRCSAVVVDPVDGRMIQRMNFDCQGLHVPFIPTRKEIIVQTGNEVWGLK